VERRHLVLAFLFADLIVLPIVAIYRKYYGWAFTLRIVALMFVTMVLAALAVDLVFGRVGLIPTGARPSRGDVFGSISVDYKLFLNVVATAVFAALVGLTMRRGATDPVCGMKVDRAKALTAERDGRTWYFCSEGCRDAFLAERASGAAHPDGDAVTEACGEHAADPGVRAR
jgi:YHS domain-containing protein